MQDIVKIAEILRDFSLHNEVSGYEEVPLLKKIQEKMSENEELVFILPAFPAKSPSHEKTHGKLPDFGEVLALKNLQSFCERLTAIYPRGARIVICSDGRAFSDVVNVSDDSIDLYNQGIREIIREFELTSLSVFTMENLYPDKTPEELRQILDAFYAAPLEEVKALVKGETSYKNLFNGIHRFLFEDALTLNPASSRSSILKETKEKAYRLLQRSDAWSQLLKAHFADTLRLSIHPHHPTHEKFGIKLVPSSSKWATPWHNVAVKIRNKFELMHKKEALSLNAVLKMENNRYAYYEVTAAH